MKLLNFPKTPVGTAFRWVGGTRQTGESVSQIKNFPPHGPANGTTQKDNLELIVFGIILRF